MIYEFLRHLIVPPALRKIRRIQGLENIPPQGGFLVTANHVSWLDPVYVTAAISQRFRGRLLFVSATAKHRWMQAVIPIEKNNRARCLTIARDKLKNGCAIGIFPHGDQRGSSEPPMTGAARLAHWTGAPLLPVAIRNCIPHHTWGSLLAFFFRGSRLEIAIGKPIFFLQTDNFSRDMLHADMSHIESAIQKLLADQ